MDETTTLEVRALTRAQAERVTERIKAGLGSVLDDLRTAMEGRAWEAMGYPSWNAYLTAEFEGQSRGNIWRIATQVEVIHALSEAEGEPVEVSAREAVETKRLAKARVRQTRPDDPDVTPTDLVDASRARDNGEIPDGVAVGHPVTSVGWGDRSAIPSYMEPVMEAVNTAAGAAEVDPRQFVIAALLAACEGVTVSEILTRGKVAALDGESERVIAAKVGVGKTSAAVLKRKAAESPRCEDCGALKPTHQNWCPRKTASR